MSEKMSDVLKTLVNHDDAGPLDGADDRNQEGKGSSGVRHKRQQDQITFFGLEPTSHVTIRRFQSESKSKQPKAGP